MTTDLRADLRVDAELNEIAKTRRVGFEYAEGYRDGRGTPATPDLEAAVRAFLADLDKTMLRHEWVDERGNHEDMEMVADHLGQVALDRLRRAAGGETPPRYVPIGRDQIRLDCPACGAEVRAPDRCYLAGWRLECRCGARWIPVVQRWPS